MISHALFICVSLIAALTGFRDAVAEVDPALLTEKYGSAIVLILSASDTTEVRLGTGFLVTADGTIMTNSHVIGSGSPVIVKLANGDVYRDVTLLHEDSQKDIAIIKIPGFDLPMVSLGNSNDMKVGIRVVVIGNPHGYEQTVSDGLLSQHRRTDEGYSLFQISAPISGGSSGSPVFGPDGTVIGIAALSDVSGQNLNFAIPINYARGLMEQPVEIRSLSATGHTVQQRSGTISSSRIARDCTAPLIAKTTEVLRAFDDVAFAYQVTTEPHKGQFVRNKYHIEPGFYDSQELLEKVVSELKGYSCSDPSFDSARQVLLEELPNAIEGIQIAVAALELSPGKQYPNWDQLHRGLSKMYKSENPIRETVRGFVVTLPDSMKQELDPNALCDLKWRDFLQDSVGDIPRIGVRFASTGRRVVVINIEWNLPADKAGIKAGDIILGTKDGANFSDTCGFLEFMRLHKPGDKVSFRILRKGEVLTKFVKLAQR